MPRLVTKESAVKRFKAIGFLPRPGDALKQQLLAALRAWITDRGLTQQQAGGALGILIGIS
jgi:hypothetical protein